MDATLREVLLTLRSISSPKHTDLQHPLAKYTFRAVYPDARAGGGGRFQTKDLGTIFARDLSNASVLSEPFDPVSQSQPQPQPQPGDGDAGDAMDTDKDKEERARREREDRTLEQMRLDYLDVAVILPKGAATTPGGHGVGPGLHIKGAVVAAAYAAAAANSFNGGGGVRGPPGADRWELGAGAGIGRSGPAAGGHWRGGAPFPAGGPSGRGAAPGGGGGGGGGGLGVGRGGFGRDRERDRDVPPPPREPRVVRERERGLREEKRERDERDDRSARFEKERRARDDRDDRVRGAIAIGAGSTSVVEPEILVGLPLRVVGPTVEVVEVEVDT
jgi:histone deacetylase complex subunit SAP18